ncbi:hypothetical protein [Pleurocapsa sp. PCC 7319]|uniref:hypothetical protein n=1 Tax=Pleurocapsa sp. PCC 7319 TaxID=118161 RepID=UPI00034D42A0|nr:hypothetical protein [Pleurocapsa sp. PCC 7319]
MYTVKVSAIASTNFITNIPPCTQSGKWTATKIAIQTYQQNANSRHVDSAEEFSKMPSLPSQEKPESYTAVDVTDSFSYPSSAINSPITVGDKVTIFDCPGHWLWASPFTVQEVEGEMVKLEMIEELVEMGQLEKWDR